MAQGLSITVNSVTFIPQGIVSPMEITKTYVVVVDCDGDNAPQEVSSRDRKSVKLIKRQPGFYFYDQIELEINGVGTEPLILKGPRMNASGTYYYGEEMNLEQVLDRFGAKSMVYENAKFQNECNGHTRFVLLHDSGAMRVLNPEDQVIGPRSDLPTS